MGKEKAHGIDAVAKILRQFNIVRHHFIFMKSKAVPSSEMGKRITHIECLIWGDRE